METSIIARARAFALARHHGQTRKDAARTPYWTHLEEVAALVAGFGGDEEIVVAAWLHDTVEDCPPTSLGEIGAAFGPRVRALVAEVTDDKSLDPAERKRRQVATAPAKSPGAALVKLCDKISNVRSVGDTPPHDWPRMRRLGYLDWAEEVVAGLRDVPDAALAAFRAVLESARTAVGRG
jgi:(p)ppGpp synthase/HD superfamily hydrolase